MNPWFSGNAILGIVSAFFLEPNPRVKFSIRLFFSEIRVSIFLKSKAPIGLKIPVGIC